MNSDVMFSSKSEEWATPWDLFNRLNSEFHFDLDPCATSENHKCQMYFTKNDDGLSKEWGGRRVFINPPYGRQIGKWVQKAYIEAKNANTLCCLLLPARTDTKWFHDYIYRKAEVRFLCGRVKFGEAKNCAPFPSMIVIYRNEDNYWKGEENV